MLDVISFELQNAQFGAGGDVIWVETIRLNLFLKGMFDLCSKTVFLWDTNDVQKENRSDASTSGTWKALSRNEDEVEIELRRNHSYQFGVITLREGAKSLFITIPTCMLWDKEGIIELALDDTCTVCSDDFCCWRCKNNHGR
jgi:hypothetical protein